MQRSNQGHTMTLHLYPPNLHLTVSQNIAQTRFYRSRSLRQGSKVKSRSDHDVAHQLLTNVLIKYQLPTPYGFRDIARTIFYRLRSLRQGQIKVRPWRCTPTPPPNQCPCQVWTSYTLRFLRYSLDKLFPAARPPIRTPWVKTIPRRAVG